MKKYELPNSAKRIILAVLENDLRISTEAMLKIIEREAGKATDDMERQFRQAKCRRLMAGIRDREGRRMVFHVPAKASANHKAEYVLISACTDPNELQAVRHRLHSYVAGLEDSLFAVNERIHLNEAVRRYLAALR